MGDADVFDEMNKTLLVIPGIIVCLVAAGAIYLGYSPKPEAKPVGYFTEYAKNPVVGVGAKGSWDSDFVFYPSVIVKGGVYYLFYSGTSSGASSTFLPYNLSIGYATSTDGYTFTDFKSNPILTRAWSPAVLLDGNTQVLYYNTPVGGSLNGPIRRATAPDPSGPWTRDEKPALEVGGEGEWDSFAITPDCVILTDSTYVMYYTVFDSAANFQGIGRATSPDGIKWTKYNNATTISPYAESDPVLKPGPTKYDAYAVWKSCVRKTATGWEMFYTGWPASTHYVPDGSINYATSSDGIHWTKFEGNPTIPAPSYDPTLFVKDSTYFLYYEKVLGGREISLATGAKPPFGP